MEDGRRNELLERAHARYGERAWDEAYGALAEADAIAPLDCDDLELLAWSSALVGRDDELLRALERLYQALAERGECARAARSAFWLGFRLFALGEPARGSGWLGRAQRMVETEGRECAETGYLLLPVVERSIGSGDFEAAEAAAQRAAAIGDRYGEADLSAFARILRGRALIRRGLIDRGLTLLDEAIVAVAGGEVSPLVTGLSYCAAIASCQQVYAFDRAREWTSALAAWCEAQPQLVTFTGSCLVHRAEIMELGGEWAEAIAEARRATEDRDSGSPDPDAAAEAFYRQAEIHRLRGERQAAETAYQRASGLGRDPQPGLALLRLAEARHDAAAGAIRRALEGTTDRLARTRFLPAYVEIMLASGDVDAAREAAHELRAHAEELPVSLLDAIAAHAEGAVHLAEGDPRSAAPLLRRAFRAWQQIGAPFIAARIRVLLGRACRELGDEDGAQLELLAARQVFERIGAGPDLSALPAEAPAGAGGAAARLTPRELEVLRLVATGKTNKVIARELCVSEKTIDRHVSNIFVKTDVSSRAAATAFAFKNGLV